MAEDTTRITISLETVLKNLNRTLRGLDQVKKKLDSIGNIKAQSRDADRALLAAQKLGIQQQKLAVQTQELNNRQERARIVSERLAQSQQRLAITQQRLDQAQQRVTRSAGQQADAHVRMFRALQQNLARAPQVDAHVRAFRAIQKGAEDANHHIKVFRAQQAALARAPQLDAHVKAFRAMERSLAKAPQMDAHVRAFRQMESASGGLNRSLAALGNSLRSVGQGLASVGATLAFSVSAPLVALGASVVNAAVRLDSLQRGLRTIAGSSQEAAEQLERLTRIAKLPGIGFEEAIQGSIRLQAVGFNAEEAERALRQFSNAIALTGGGRENLETVTVQLGQMAAQSKVLAADLKPIINAAPAVAVALREAFGTVRSEELQELGISSKQFIDILVAQLERLPRAAAGARNSFENFRDELFRAAATVGTVLLPALTRLVEVAGPIVTTLANAFAALPVPLQVIVVGFTGLLAIAGPVTFIIGQLTLGIGRLIVGFAELNATGILPTIASLRALTAGTLSAAAAQRTLAATTALVSGGVGLVLTAIAAVVTGFALYNAFQKDSVTLGREQIDALSDQIVGLREQAKFVSSLSVGVERTADEQQRLLDIYSDLNRAAKIRITTITDEEQRLNALREELQRLIALREQERIQQAASIAAELANSLQKIQANERERDSIAARIQQNAALIETLEREQKISAETQQALAQRAIGASNVQEAIGALKAESESLSAAQDALIASSKELNDTTKDQVAIIQALEKQTGLTARELLVAAQSMGRFRGDVAAMIPVLERYIQKTDEATKSTDGFNRAQTERDRQIAEIGKKSDEAAKRRVGIISGFAALARETSVNFEGALKSFRQMVDAVPQLSAALKRESELTGKSLDQLIREAVDDAFKGRRDKSTSGTGLRNARQQLADAIADVALAGAEREVEIEKDRGERLLQAAEAAQRLRLISYREFLETRAQLTAEDLDREIIQQGKIVAAARLATARLASAAQTGPPAEQTRRQAQAKDAEADAIRAETKLLVLQERRGAIESVLNAARKEAQDIQLRDVIRLEIAFAELQGKIEAALQVATVEEFREALEELGKAQDFLSKQIEKAGKEGKTARVAELKAAQDLNQRQIDTIQLTVRSRDALAELAAAERLVENAKDRQRQLEEQLAFDVEFRGLKEEAAIKQRLDGERRLQASIELSKSVIEDARDELIKLGAIPPPELQRFIDSLKVELLGLTELSFTEQFRLAEKEFNRLNDERISKIQDVERAVRNRDIAEIEGLILIRRINGQYVGDLERQLELLKAIADKSNQDELRSRTADIGETVKDARDEVADFDRQLRAVSIDSLQDSLGQLFKDLRDNSENALQDILNFLSRIGDAISDMIAENLAKEFIESLFPDPATTGGGIVGFFKRMLGVGGGGAGVEAVAHGAEATEHAIAVTALTTGATAAATALTTGGTAAGATLLASVATAATAFSAAVIAAGTAFAAAVGLSNVSQQAGNFTRFIGGGESGLYPAVPGGLYKFVEGGYPEAVITTDPRHAARQVSILRELITKTRGFYGRVPEFASGAIVSRETAEANLLSSINRAPQFSPSLPASAMETATGVASMNLRVINQVSSRALTRPYLTSEEGVRDVMNIISTNSNEIARRLPIRGR